MLIGYRLLQCFPGVSSPIDSHFESVESNPRNVPIHPDGLAPPSVAIPFIVKVVPSVERGKPAVSGRRAASDPLGQYLARDRKKTDRVIVALVRLLGGILGENCRPRISVT